MCFHISARRWFRLSTSLAFSLCYENVRCHRSTPIVPVPHNFLRPLQEVRLFAHLQYSACHCTLVSAEYVAQTQNGMIAFGEAEFELGDDFTAKPTRMVGHPSDSVRSTYRSTSKLTISSLCRPGREAYLPLGRIEDQAVRSTHGKV